MPPPLLLPLLLAAPALVVSLSPLRSGCGEGEPVLATLPAGTAVEIRSALSGDGGACYKVTVDLEGKTVSGYLPQTALGGAGAFDQARREAREIGGAAKPVAARTVAATTAVPKAPRDHPAAKALALLEAAQPAEALRLVEPHLTRHPTDPFLHAVAGLAYYRMDDLDRALLHWKEAEAIQPDPQIQALIARALREKGADAGSDRTAGLRVVLRYERGSVAPDLALAMVAVLDEEYARIAHTLGCRANERVTAIVQSPAAYRQATQAAEWSGALYDGRIHVPAPPGRQVSPELRRTFAHELAHACLHQLGSWPAWLHEGIAQQVSGEPLPAQERTQIEALLRERRLPKLRQLGRSWAGLSAAEAALAYRLAHYAAVRLTELYANTGLGNLLRNPESFARYEQELEAALGL